MKKAKIYAAILLPCICAFVLNSSQIIGIYNRINQKIYAHRRDKLSERILEHTEGFYSVTGKNARIRYTDADADYLDMLLFAIDLYYPLLAADYGITAVPLAEVVVYPDAASLKRAVGSNTLRDPAGVYYGGVLNIISPGRLSSAEAEAKDMFLDIGPLVHELSHYLTDIKTNGNCDKWFSEGLALYYEYKYLAFEWRPELKEKSRAISMTQLKYGFDSLDADSAYRRAFDIVNGMGEMLAMRIVEELSSGGRLIVKSPAPATAAAGHTPAAGSAASSETSPARAAAKTAAARAASQAAAP